MCLCAIFAVLFPGHTHTQLLSVSLLLTTLEIAVQSMLDLFLHQSHTSPRAARFILEYLCQELHALGEESRRTRARKSHEREDEVISQASPHAQSHR